MIQSGMGAATQIRKIGRPRCSRLDAFIAVTF
jgi:hypothetical protein